MAFHEAWLELRGHEVVVHGVIPHGCGPALVDVRATTADAARIVGPPRSSTTRSPEWRTTAAFAAVLADWALDDASLDRARQWSSALDDCFADATLRDSALLRSARVRFVVAAEGRGRPDRRRKGRRGPLGHAAPSLRGVRDRADPRRL
jgi:hypothetical protein